MKWWLPNASQIKYFEQEFAKLEQQYDVPGRLLPALWMAVHRAQLASIPLSDRTLEKVLDLIRGCYEAKTGRKRSRLTQYKRDYIHWLRYVALSNAFRIQGVEYSKRSGRPKKATGGINEARECAKKHLERGVARVNSLRQIQDSYDLVKKHPARFAFFDH
jgi:hypothetical protein